jgi:hypothetical protein
MQGLKCHATNHIFSHNDQLQMDERECLVNLPPCALKVIFGPIFCGAIANDCSESNSSESPRSKIEIHPFYNQVVSQEA